MYLSYQFSTNLPVNDDSEMVPLIASNNFEFDELNDPDFTHSPQKPILNEITTVKFISELIEVC